MLFNSFEYLLFFPLVVALYYLIPHRFRWLLLLIASYIFYMSWKMEYILLIVFSTIIDYFAGRKMSSLEDKSKRKKFLYLSLLTNLGLLFYFKYFNFFTASFQDLVTALGYSYLAPHMDFLLPVGISFYTFQTMSYSIDVYQGKTKVEKHFGIFALFVSFFPQLVAGPIERSERLLPQFRKVHKFNYQQAADGLKLVAWGLFKKVVIADRVAYFVNEVFNNPSGYDGLDVLVAVIFFAFQIYCDFSGYSDIAIGTAQVMGFDLMKNFDRPYFAKTISEFWRRWHISLSTWFRDYVYIPLGGSRTLKWRWYYNLFITFLVSGLWHGANWTFVIWGALHGFYMVFATITKNQRKSVSKNLGLLKSPLINRGIRMLSTFILVCFAWVFFRANSLSDALTLLSNATHFDGFHLSMIGDHTYEFILSIIFILVMETIHFVQRNKDMRQFLNEKPPLVRWGLYVAIIISILNFGVFDNSEFIYFQF